MVLVCLFLGFGPRRKKDIDVASSFGIWTPPKMHVGILVGVLSNPIKQGLPPNKTHPHGQWSEVGNLELAATSS